MWKVPGFTAVALITLALGIGVNTAIFTLTEAVLLGPLPVRQPHEIASLGDTMLNGGRRRRTRCHQPRRR